MKPSIDSIAREVLLRAAELLGGPEHLAKRLAVPSGELERWISGESVPPAPVVFTALNIIERRKEPPPGHVAPAALRRP